MARHRGPKSASLLAIGFILLAGSSPHTAGGRSEGAPALSSRLPAIGERVYQMNARLRPLLFWMQKTDVGDARITWRGLPEAGRGYELLVGSDPRKAPRRINRWGFIREEISPDGAFVVGVMKQSKEQSVKEAEQQIAREGEGGFVFQAIQAQVTNERAIAGVVTVRTAADLTFRDLGPLLARVAAVDAPRHVTPLPSGTGPGFLWAVADLVHQTAVAPVGPKGRAAPPPPRTYVYNSTIYDVRITSLRLIDAPSGVRQPGGAIESNFEVLNRRTGNRTHFSITYGRSGPLAEIPILIKYRPRWWFEVELRLRDEATGTATVG